MPEDDLSLFQSYQNTGSETAFRSLVDRHLPMVYGVALRRTRNRELAQEIAQNVFTTLAGKARSGFQAQGPLNGWLYQTTINHSRTAMRTARNRRHVMERFQADALSSNTEGNPLPPELHDLLDAALGHLSADDRTIVLQRYVEGRSFREIGQAIGRNEDTSRKRVARALEKITSYFRRHGHAVPTITLTTTLAAIAAISLPKGFAATVAGTSISSAATQPLAVAVLSSKLLPVAVALVAFSLPVALQLHANYRQSQIQKAATLTSTQETQRQIVTPTVSASQAKTSPSVAETLRALAKHPNPAHALASIEAFLSDLSRDQLQAALAALPRLAGANPRIRIGSALFSRWATFDPLEALAMADTVPDPYHRRGAHWGAIRSWAASDPDAAEAYIDGIEGPLGTQLANAFWNGLSATTPKAAFDKADALTDQADRSKRLSKAFYQWQRTDPLSALEQIRGRENSSQRDSWIARGLSNYADFEPGSAFELGLEFVAEGSPESVLTDTLTAWVEQDPAAAFVAATTLSPSKELDQSISRMAAYLSDWSEVEDVLSVTPEQFQGRLIHGLARGAQWGNWSEAPERYATIAELIPEIPNIVTRREAASNLKWGWEQAAPEEASTWFESFEKSQASAE